MDAIVSILEALADQRRPASGSAAPKAAANTSASISRSPQPPSPKPAAPAAPAQPIAVSPPENHGFSLQGMFTDGNSLLRAIIAAEVVGPPVSLKEHHFWNQQPNEPST